MYLEALSEPMMPDLEEIPRLRKALGLTQTAIARLANVSQSTIVKIEKRQMNPSYDSVKRIMNALQAELKRQEKKALVDQIQSRKVQYVEARIRLNPPSTRCAAGSSPRCRSCTTAIPSARFRTR